MKYRILFVEDEKILGQLVKEALQKHGYDVRHITNGIDALEAFKSQRSHLCLLDIMLPGKDGYDVAQQIRSLDNNVPILFLTAKVQAANVIEGFKAGCNDYIRKPFSMDELLMRMDNWLKEKYGQKEQEVVESYEIGNYTFYPLRQLLQAPESTVSMTHKESVILTLLYTHRNSMLGRDYLLEKVWGSNTIYNSRSLDVYINRLRKYFINTPFRIITLKSIGYRFICE